MNYLINAKDAFQCLNILIAIRNSNAYILTRRDDKEINMLNSSEGVYEFICFSLFIVITLLLLER